MQCVAVCCSVLQYVAVSLYIEQTECVAACCSVLQRIAVCCSVLQCVAVCCSVVQCVAMCCSLLLRLYLLEFLTFAKEVRTIKYKCEVNIHIHTFRSYVLQCVATHRNTLQHTAPYCNTLHGTAKAVWTIKYNCVAVSCRVS